MGLRYRLVQGSILLSLLICAPSVRSQDSLVVHAVRAVTAPVIDGRLDDTAWEKGLVTSQFTQKEPVEYGQPTQRSETVVLYDDDAVYIGARLYDTAPDSIVGKLARRDTDIPSDIFMLYLDPYHDHRSGYYFGLNAAGTRYDGTRYNDNWSDATWDGVWDGEVSRDSEGWSAEFRIPYSQLRFHKRESQIWGVNFRRGIARHNENNYLVFTPSNGSGFVSRFPNLVGIENISPPRYTELIPYVRARARYQDYEPGDPFRDGSEYRPNLGADFKLGLGSNLTLDATVNPDFGQVEVDPAVVNLSDYETFYSEKRPFFIEGASIYNFGQGGATDWWGFNWSGVDFFYSRRIGRPPQGRLPDNNFSDVPESAHILGAAKISGKLRGNWNLGSLHGLTMREFADIENGHGEERVEMEPASYYTVTRAQKEMNDGRQGLGGIFTATHRFFDDDRLKEDLNASAFSGGIDGWTALDKDKTYMLAGWTGLTHVSGTPERMVRLQRSSAHYYQRPDLTHIELDSSATALTGVTGRLNLNKEKGNVILNTAVGTISPGFNANDIGFNGRSDLINGHFGYGYRWTKPTSWTRHAQVIGSVFGNWDYGGHSTWSGIWSNAYFTFLNYWSYELSLAVNPVTSLNTTRTRGGPMSENPVGWELNTEASTDSRKPWVFRFGTFGYTVAKDDWNRGVWFTAQWKPAANLDVQLSPELFWNIDWLGWVDSFDDSTATATYGRRYVFANLDQTQLSASFRINWTFTPKLSLQLYAQPLITSGDYEGFKELEQPRSYEFEPYGAEQIQYAAADDEYHVDPDGSGPSAGFDFDNPDFDYRSIRGNVILRWEYVRGSTLYFVWTHGRVDNEGRGQFDMNRSLDRLANADQDNIFLIKATYWLSW